MKELELETSTDSKNTVSQTDLNALRIALTSTDTFSHFYGGKRFRAYNTSMSFDSLYNRVHYSYKLYQKGFHLYRYTFKLEDLGRIKARKGYLVLRAKKETQFNLSYRAARTYIDRSIAVDQIRMDLPPAVKSRDVKNKRKKTIFIL